MNASNIRLHSTLLKASLVGMAFSFSGAVLAAGGEAVTSQPNQNLEEKHGRDSVTALSNAPIYMPAERGPQTFGRAGGSVGTDHVEMMKTAPSSNPSSAAVKSGTSSPGSLPDDSAAIERFHNAQ